MARLRRTLPSLARCERPRKAWSRAWRDQPGRLAQGPEEKLRLAGRWAGLPGVVMLEPTLPDSRPSVGRGFPRAVLAGAVLKVKQWRNAAVGRRASQEG